MFVQGKSYLSFDTIPRELTEIFLSREDFRFRTLKFLHFVIERRLRIRRAPACTREEFFLKLKTGTRGASSAAYDG